MMLIPIAARPSKRHRRQRVRVDHVRHRDTLQEGVVLGSCWSYLHCNPDPLLMGIDGFRTYVVLGWQDCTARLFEQVGICVRHS